MAFLRREVGLPDLEYRLVSQEPLIVVLPSDHKLASRESIALEELVGETLIHVSNTAPTLKAVVDAYLQQSGFNIPAQHVADNLGMFMSLVTSTRGVAILPRYTQNFFPWSVTGRQLEGRAPTIDLVIGFNRKNTSSVLKLFLSRVDELIENVAHRFDATRHRPTSSVG